mmetsp:Transcript_29144/g.96439  ORF Transcript_29144/g.96439 Transcript_29144/m.96439 type:complete len:335 (+) Transcript_29144:877-1881(+)
MRHGLPVPPEARVAALRPVAAARRQVLRAPQVPDAEEGLRVRVRLPDPRGPHHRGRAHELLALARPLPRRRRRARRRDAPRERGPRRRRNYGLVTSSPRHVLRRGQLRPRLVQELRPAPAEARRLRGRRRALRAQRRREVARVARGREGRPRLRGARQVRQAPGQLRDGREMGRRHPRGAPAVPLLPRLRPGPPGLRPRALERLPRRVLPAEPLRRLPRRRAGQGPAVLRRAHRAPAERDVGQGALHARVGRGLLRQGPHARRDARGRARALQRQRHGHGRRGARLPRGLPRERRRAGRQRELALLEGLRHRPGAPQLHACSSAWKVRDVPTKL